MKTANLAIVFTDIQGFTERTSRQTHEENQRLLQVHHDLLAPLFTRFGGRIIKSIGDAFLVTFESPTQAVLSGVAIQDRLWEYNRTALESEQLRVRVAINVGEVRVEPNDVFGEPVNIAARVEGIAEPGEVYFTEALYLSMNKAEVPSEEVGAFELKGIPGKIRVFRVPKGPYRMEAPVVPLPAPAGIPPVGPPFANLGLARLSAEGGALSAVGQRAAVLGGQAKSAGGQFLARLRSRLPAGFTGLRMAMVFGGLAVVLGVAVVGFGGSSAERAISQVRDAKPTERPALVLEARKLIESEKNLGNRQRLFGELQEAVGDMAGAVDRYVDSVRAGNGKAGDRLTELLTHEECRVRVDAAKAVGELRLKSARGELKDLAEEGGPGDGEKTNLLDRVLGGCDSRKAARNALERFKND
ncbi:adenylate/guanylate cyclase domain-containing protein [Hyalangium minutum]|uniref:Adenylate cyclase n=1 Tax=Hyalangium minutum TaxID=394096 RepID=A0A085WPJ8_9BACT|nr:adenylate/guanylate cyclase domain-containing protein [Hyalangium minutum]KFE69611.1 Adenylate cyclase [Hyalangium minutum]